MIDFNIPYLSGKESEYIFDVLQRLKFSRDGKYMSLCHDFFERRYGFLKCLLTTSCTDALEMAAILIDIQPGDEVILPSYTFVSTANAFILRGATLVFVDSMESHPNIDASKIEKLITSKTKAIVPVHYAGVACDMDKIMELADKYNLYVIEDAAQAIDSYHISKDGTKKPLGSIGHLSAFSFHNTKNIISGEGGMLVINDPKIATRAEIVWEKGTNRTAFFRGEVDKYTWQDVGSSFSPSEIIAAFLWAQLEHLDEIQEKRKYIWNLYQKGIKTGGFHSKICAPYIPEYATNNAHTYYLVANSEMIRTDIIDTLKKNNIQAVFHYLALHSSPYFKTKYSGVPLIQSDRYSTCLFRLPLYPDLRDDQIQIIVEKIHQYEENSVRS